MKTLELVSRKNTTEKARQSVIDFIESFDFSNLEDLAFISSKEFIIFYDATGSNDYHNRAYFELNRQKGFTLVTYSSEFGNNERDSETWTDVSKVFDGTCTYINFKQLVDAMQDFIEKINKAAEAKESEISDFLEYVEGWKSYQDTAKNADELEALSENV